MSANPFKRLYRRQQAFVFGFGIAMFFIGLVMLLFPADDVTLIAAGVPAYARFLDHLGYLLAGLFLAVGIARTSPALEAGGHVLIAALFLIVGYISIGQADTLSQALGAGGFVVPLALGSAARGYLLLTMPRGE